MGGPQIVDGNYNCSSNLITSLVGCAKHIDGSLVFDKNGINSFVGIHKIIKSCNRILFECNEIKHGGIGLLLIKKLTTIDADNTPFRIIEQYLGTDMKGMMECSKELIKKGFDNYAKL